MAKIITSITGDEALTFDDVLLVPRHSVVHPSDVITKSRFTRGIELNVPLVAAAMGFAPGTVAKIWPTPASLSLVQLRVTPEGEIHDGHLLALGVPSA